MKKLITILSLALLAACGEKKDSETTYQNQDAKFDAFKERFVESLWKQFPGWASGQGYHKYDSVLVIPNDASRNSDLVFCKSYMDSLKRFDINELSNNNKTDYHMIEDQLKSSQWYITDYKSFE